MSAVTSATVWTASYHRRESAEDGDAKMSAARASENNTPIPPNDAFIALYLRPEIGQIAERELIERRPNGMEAIAMSLSLEPLVMDDQLVAVGVVVVVLLIITLYYCWKSGNSGSSRKTWRGSKHSRDNRSNQMNPNNWRFWNVDRSLLRNTLASTVEHRTQHHLTTSVLLHGSPGFSTKLTLPLP
ncbi:hypothetical protein Bbelb_221430 [Branchiostoma belcheri]|nr:hypothetical protein Bbelb_221430 [Branchiostoma belcheri]